MSVTALQSVLLAACAGSGADVEPALVPMPAGLTGIYAGEFPCSNCVAIDAALWLRTDQRFYFRQRYVDEPGDDAPNAYALGHWRWDAARGELVLAGAGPERRLSVLAPDGLELRTAALGPHVLWRDESELPFTESVPFSGIAIVSGGAATFRECQWQLELEVAADDGFVELRRQHRHFSPRGRPALTAVVGHLRHVADETGSREQWVIDRVVSVNPDKTC